MRLRPIRFLDGRLRRYLTGDPSPIEPSRQKRLY